MNEFSSHLLRFKTNDIDELGEHIRRLGFDTKCKLLGSNSFRFESMHVIYPGLTVNSNYGTCPMSMEVEPVSDLLNVHVSVTGEFELFHSSSQRDDISQSVAIIPARDVHRGMTSTPFRQHGAMIDVADLRLFYAQIMDLDVPRLPEFTFQRRSLEKARPLADLVAAALALGEDASQARLGLTCGFVKEALYSYIVEMLRSGAPNTVTALDSDIGSAKLKKAMELIEANAQSATSLAEIASELNVSLRAIQKAFKSALGLTPHEFRQKIRLRSAIDEIRTMASTDSPRDIARRWGFSNYGRFSMQCLQETGFRPRELRQRVSK